MPGLSMYGDSLIDTGYDSANERTFNRWISGPLVSLLGPTFDGYSNYGVGGETIEDALARVATVTADTNEYVLVVLGLNNLTRPDATFESMTSAYIQILEALQAAGKKTFVMTVFPRKLTTDGGSGLPEKESVRIAFNEWLRRLPRGQGKLIIDLIDTDYINWNPRTEAGDGTHPDTSKCVIIAEAIAHVINRHVSHLALSENLLPAGADFHGLGGSSASAHIFGEIPTNWRLIDTQEGTETISLSNDRGASESLTLEFLGTPSGSNKSDLLRWDQTGQAVALNDKLICAFDLELRNVQGLIAVAMQLELPYGGGNQYVSAMWPGGTGNDYWQLPANQKKTRLWTPPHTVIEAVNASVRFAFYYRDDADISGQVILSDPALYRFTA